MKLYIGNLPFSATEEKIREMLEQYGTLQSFNWITDRDTGKPRGFCFAEMDNADADAAIKSLNGKDFGGRNLKVNEAKPRNDRRKKRSW
jgi:RNA recognition motif-containing protein